MPGQAPPLTDERDLLLAYVGQQREGIRNAAFGLTDDQARLTPTAGTLSIGGLVKHVTLMERTWIAMVEQRPDPGGEDGYITGWQFGPDDSLEAAVADLDRAAAETAAAMLLHLIEEIARHAGHADIVREAIDGATMFPLMAAVEGWPATDWLQPWSPGSTA